MPYFFVIRHKPTKSLLPARVRATHWDFDMPDGVFEPRLFNTERAALNCATCWAQGTWERKTYTESDGWEHPSYTCQSEPRPTAVPGRKREDLEVVPVELMF